MRLTKAEGALAAGLVAWSLLPIVVLAGGGDVFNGSDGLQVADHMQYLSFIRDSGEHVLISNRLDVAADPHLFLHPMYVLSGLLWKLGASVQLAFLAWKPVTVVLLFIGFAAYVRRLLSADRTKMALALLLALFSVSIAAPLADWLGGSADLQFGTFVVGFEMFAAGYTWGASSGTISVALMPLFLLGIERVLEPSRRREGRSARWYAVWAGVAGMLCSWLHPWQGITLLAIILALAAWERLDRHYLALAVPVALTAAPLAYFWVLSQTDTSWQHVSQPNDFAHVGIWLVAGLAPALLALPGFPGRDLDLQERILRIWPAAAIVVYFALQSSWFYHAFVGLSLPLAVLAVRGWGRLRLPRLATAAVVLALTVPGMVFAVTELYDGRADHFFRSDEAAVLDYLDDSPRPGAVLAPRAPLGQAVPGLAGRNTFVGHYTWTPDYGAREAGTEDLFEGRLSARAARRLVRESGAAFLASDCRGRADLEPLLRRLLLRVRRFGCATVYELRPPA